MAMLQGPRGYKGKTVHEELRQDSSEFRILVESQLADVAGRSSMPGDTLMSSLIRKEERTPEAAGIPSSIAPSDRGNSIPELYKREEGPRIEERITPREGQDASSKSDTDAAEKTRDVKDRKDSQAEKSRDESAKSVSEEMGSVKKDASQKEKISGEDMKGLIAGLMGMGNVLKETPRLQKDFKDLIKGLQDLLNRENGSRGKLAQVPEETLNGFKSLVLKLRKLLGSTEKASQGVGKEVPVKLTELRRYIENLIAVLEKQNRQISTGKGRTESSHFTIKDVNREVKNPSVEQKMVSLQDNLVMVKKEGGSAFQGETGFGMGQFSRGDAAGAKSLNVPAGVPRGPIFQEQLQNLIQTARITVRDGNNGNLSLNLYPESLGKVNIHLGLEQGVLTGRFIVDTPEAKDVLMDNLDVMKSQMEEAGLAVGEFQVNVRDNSDRSVYQEKRGGVVALNALWEKAEGTQEYNINAVSLHDGMIDMKI